jgi:hypothetical protein
MQARHGEESEEAGELCNQQLRNNRAVYLVALCIDVGNRRTAIHLRDRPLATKRKRPILRHCKKPPCPLLDGGARERTMRWAPEVGPNERRRRLIFIPIVFIRVVCIQVVCIQVVCIPIRTAESAEGRKLLKS